MATGTGANFVIYQPEFYAGMYERVAQNLAVFNAASSGCLRMVTQQLKGDYEKESFLKTPASLITRRDITSVTGVADTPMIQGEHVSVKINRKIGPVGQTIDGWRKIGKDEREMSFKLGQMVGEEQLKDYINTAILALKAGIYGQATNVFDYSGTGTLVHGALVSGLQKMGDAGQRIRCWVMHSVSWYHLMGQSITDKITNVADVVINAGNVATLNRPVIVTDAPGLFIAGATTVSDDKYAILGVVQDGLVLKESEEREIELQKVLGSENIIYRMQGEYAYNIGLKGLAWDVSNGGVNPTDATLAITTNWDKVATDTKDLPGIGVTEAAA